MAEGAFKCLKRGVTVGSTDYCGECGEPLTLGFPGCGTIWRFWENNNLPLIWGANEEKIGVKPARQSINNVSVSSR